MMKPQSSSLFGYCVGFFLLEVMTSASGKWTVTIPTRPLVATVGGQAELSCQLSPSQSAKHMQVSWFKGDNSKLVHLYRDGHEVSGEVAPEYVDRTEFVKEAIREGKVTLRLHNISISDSGTYQCSFKDNDFSDVASMNLSVAALGLETQIHIKAPSTAGLMVECNSGGWFPEPQMEWRDSKGEVVPHSSKSDSQDGAGLLHMKMTLLLKNKPQDNIICYIRNPLLGKGKQINIILADALFHPVHIWLTCLISFVAVILFLIIVSSGIQLHRKPARDENAPGRGTPYEKCCCDLVRLLNSLCAQSLCFGCFVVLMVVYIGFRIKVPISGPFFSLYNDWIRDIATMVFILMIFYGVLIYGLYWTIKGYFIRNKTNEENGQRRSQQCRHGKGKTLCKK